MAFTGSQVQRRKSIGVCAVYNLKELVVLVKLLFRITQDSVDLIRVAAIDFGPVVHLDLLDILLSLALLA